MAGTAAWALPRELRDLYQQRLQRVVPEPLQPDEDNDSPTECKAEARVDYQPFRLQHRHQTQQDRVSGSSDHSVPQVRAGEAEEEPEPVAPEHRHGQVLSRDDVELIDAVAPGLLHPSQPVLPREPSLPKAIPRRDPHGKSSASRHAIREAAECSDESREGTPTLGLLEHAGAAAAPAAPQDLQVEVDFTLTCLRGYSQGVSDVIGTLDWSEEGTHFATGGIARKIRVYSMATLAQRKAELMASLEGKRSKSIGDDEDVDDDEDDVEEAGEEEICSQSDADGARRRCRRSKRRQESRDLTAEGADAAVPFFMRCGHGGLRRKQKASSTSNLVELAEKDLVRRERGQVLDSDACASKILCTAAKLSSLQWCPWTQGAIGCADYDGVFCEWDVETGMCVTERDEHQGQKIWSMKYSQSPAVRLAATASEDGAVKLWTAGSEDCVGTMAPSPGSALCSVDFSADGRYLATGGADAVVYMYDLRNCMSPLAILQGHGRTISYTRFLDSNVLVSSSIDSTVKVWDISRVRSCPETAALKPVASGADHVNKRNFTGLAVRADGMILTGSEANELIGYKYSGGKMWNCLSFNYGTGQISRASSGDLSSPALSRKPFVSAISWRSPTSNSLAAANSDGTVRVMRIL